MMASVEVGEPAVAEEAVSGQANGDVPAAVAPEKALEGHRLDVGDGGVSVLTVGVGGREVLHYDFEFLAVEMSFACALGV